MSGQGWSRPTSVERQARIERAREIAGLALPVDPLERAAKQVVGFMDRWVECHPAGALIFPVAADFPKMSEGEISAARQIRRQPGRNRMALYSLRSPVTSICPCNIDR